MYENRGFRVVCHGYRGLHWRNTDTRFLHKQLDELLRHRRVASNRLGSAIFYGASVGCEVGVYGDPMVLADENPAFGGVPRMSRLWPDLLTEHAPRTSPSTTHASSSGRTACSSPERSAATSVGAPDEGRPPARRYRRPARRGGGRRRGDELDELDGRRQPAPGERPAPSLDTSAVSPGHVQLIGGDMFLWSDLEPGVGVTAMSPLLLPAVERLMLGKGNVLVLGLHQIELLERLAAQHSDVDVVVRGWKDADSLAHDTGRLPNVRIHCGDAGRLSTTARYDLVVAMAGVEAIMTPDGVALDAQALLDRLVEFVAADGRLLVALENPFGLDRIVSAQTRLERDASSDWPRPGRGFGGPSLRDVEARLADSGFRVTERMCLFPSPTDPAIAVIPASLEDPASRRSWQTCSGSSSSRPCPSARPSWTRSPPSRQPCSPGSATG